MCCSWARSVRRTRTEMAVTTSHRPASAPRTGQAERAHRAQQVALRTPFWVLTTGLAIIFLFPVVWTTVSSVSPQAGTSQHTGWGFGNYSALAHYQAGIWRYLGNSLLVS